MRTDGNVAEEDKEKGTAGGTEPERGRSSESKTSHRRGDIARTALGTSVTETELNETSGIDADVRIRAGEGEGLERKQGPTRQKKLLAGSVDPGPEVPIRVPFESEWHIKGRTSEASEIAPEKGSTNLPLKVIQGSHPVQTAKPPPSLVAERNGSGTSSLVRGRRSETKAETNASPASPVSESRGQRAAPEPDNKEGDSQSESEDHFSGWRNLREASEAELPPRKTRKSSERLEQAEGEARDSRIFRKADARPPMKLASGTGGKRASDDSNVRRGSVQVQRASRASDDVRLTKQPGRIVSTTR